MKLRNYLYGFVASAMIMPAIASTPMYHITGATAFRRATIESIDALFDASGVAYRFAANRAGTDWVNSDLVIWEGTITGFNGNQPVIIRTSFNGSIEGLRAVTLAEIPASNPEYFLTSVLTATPVVGGAQEHVVRDASVVETFISDIAFSDTEKAISPYASDPMIGGEVGVAVFAVVANDGSPITNVSAQNYNSLLATGRVPLSFFTGDPADSNHFVFATGRNDGSGTRSSYLAEMGYGVSNPVRQHLTISRDGDNITAIQLVPEGGTNDSDPVTEGVQLPPGSDILAWEQAGNVVDQDTRSRSIVWGLDQDGNGGAFSGGALRGDLARKSGAVVIFDAEGNYTIDENPREISLISWISLNDALTARDGGATLVEFNGYSIDMNADANGIVTPGGEFLSVADKEKCYNGQYSAWNFQQMYRRFGTGADVSSLYDLIAGSIPNNLGSAGLRSEDFNVGRSSDGGLMNPL